MSAVFPFKKERSSLFGTIHRPIAQVSFKHIKKDLWRQIDMIVDSGADYTILPKTFALSLGVSFSKDCRKISTQGVGGSSVVYLYKQKLKTKIGDLERSIPVGFFPHDLIPPLLGRQGFFETFKVTFENYKITFE